MSSSENSDPEYVPESESEAEANDATSDSDEEQDIEPVAQAITKSPNSSQGIVCRLNVIACDILVVKSYNLNTAQSHRFFLM